MGLLLIGHDPKSQRLTNEIFTRQLRADTCLQEELDGRTRQKMYQNVQYNVDFLYTAPELEDEGISEWYARRLFQLLIPLMSHCTRERVRDIMVNHYEPTRSCMEPVTDDKQTRLHRLLDCTARATVEERACGSQQREVSESHEQEIAQYLDRMLQADTEEAMASIMEYVKTGTPLSDICVDIVAEATRRVGDLWHSHQISVDMEHYCTFITQMSPSQLYPLIFNQQWKGKKVLVACMGSGLHGIGARMVADMFEYSGWDSIHLGAAVPVEAVENTAREHAPTLVALSVTMPQHPLLCRDAVQRPRTTYPQVRIVVGGYIFEEMEIWKSWDVDIYTKDAKEFVAWVDNKIRSYILCYVTNTEL